MIPAVSYLRVSSDAQEESISAQRASVQVFAKRHGYRILREYVDEGISGDATEKRTAFLKMRADAARRDFVAVLAWDIDRFGRFDLLDAGHWIKPLRDAGVRLVTVTQGAVDWNDFAGRVMYGIQAEAKHQFLRDLSKNINRGKLAKAQAGKWMGGPAPYGYQLAGKATLAINAAEADTVRIIFGLIADGESLTATALHLNAERIPSPGGGTWSKNAVTRIVDNIVYCGHVRYNRTSQAKYSKVVSGTIVAVNTVGRETINDKSLWTIVKNAHPAIVTDKQFDAAAKVRRRDTWGSGRPSSHVNLFRGILKCGRCGRAMHGAWVAPMNDMVFTCSGYLEKRECNANRTYQKPLAEALAKEIRERWLSPADRKRAEVEYMNRKSPPTSVDIAALGKRLIALRVKQNKLEVRLGEVESSLVPAISGQLRAVMDAVESMEHKLSAASKATPDDARRQLNEYRRFLDDVKEALDGTIIPTVNLAALFGLLFSSVRVVSTLQASGQPKGRYAITDLKYELNSP